jgi:hypothetical protein
MKLYANIRSLEIDMQRNHFTRHGQQLNYLGKELVALELTKLIQQHCNKAQNKTIQM